MSFVTEKSKEMAKLAVSALEDVKGQDIKVLDISEVSVMSDLFIIANGTNKNQINALKNRVDEILGHAGYFVNYIEGHNNSNWILMDYGDIVIHIFDDESRKYYDLERIWRDAKEFEF
ncbi:ribosome silencing factor [Butyrivibrio sp. NC3005]|uniref:ribosome silencing factor n=1 Tax=Butyrivibrio sp. NC3005 TaxID=1280685 RepID=UPI00040E7BA0|nr:ribosome silencing factor [Butyrivibrio sp. NC3005]